MIPLPPLPPLRPSSAQASHVLVSKRGPIVCVNCDLSNAAPIISAAHLNSASVPLRENEGTMECTATPSHDV